MIRDEITRERDSWRSLGAGYLLQEFILRHGQQFTAQHLPKRYKMRVPKNCFYNAQALARRSQRLTRPAYSFALRYVEGYVLSPNVPILIHHAWCVDRDDRVIDVTLQDWSTRESVAAECEFYGIVFERRFWPSRRDGDSVLDSCGGFRIGTWLEFDPSFTAALDEARLRSTMFLRSKSRNIGNA